MAGRLLRKVTKRFFIFINGFIALFFLLACLVPFLNPSQWWFMGFLGLMFPYLAILLIFSVIFWWVVKPALSIISILTLLAGWKQFAVLFAVNPNTTFTSKKDSSHIRIVDWNIRSFEGLSGKTDKKRIDRLSIAEAIISRNPDVICLQEFNNSTVQDNLYLFKKYPYHFFSKDYFASRNNYKGGSIIFSKYKIIDTAKIAFPGEYSESLISADIQIPNHIIRVYTTHLQSFRFDKKDYEGMDRIKSTEEEALRASKTLFQKMKLAFTKRGQQARIVRNALDKSPYPSVVCGDFNDVPNSYTYFHIKKNWHDAFLSQSVGIGRTYIDVAPTLRIDYILPDNSFNIHQFDMVDEDLSDHLMLVTDISIK
jgi:endonuclease/exonuclease/phosphatase family metal-dependent hydrolase